MRSFSYLATALLASNAAADAVMGFNSGSTLDTGAIKQESDFEAEFTTAANLVGAPGAFTSVRLYTMIQGGTTNDPISAFQAAMKTNTTMLLGIWCSGTTTIDNELTALSKAISQYGSSFTDLVVGISVGSEDLYRISATGITNKSGVGQSPDVLAGFISDVRKAIKGTGLESVPIGHVDTYDIWSNSSNKAVLDAIDFLGIDAYPYYESNKGDNSIGSAKSLWDAAMSSADAAANGKPVWITETGWPSSGPNWGQAAATHDNAKQYWDDIGCSLFGKTNVWWYTLRDSNPANEAKFAVTSNLSTTPLYNLTCPAVKASASSSSSSSSSSAASASGTSGTSSTATGSSALGSDGTSLATGAEAASSPNSATAASTASTFAPSYVAALVLAVAAHFML